MACTDATPAAPHVTLHVAAVPSQGGTVRGGGSYVMGASVTLSEAPALGYTFVNWTAGGQPISTASTFTTTATRDLDIAANFLANYRVEIRDPAPLTLVADTLLVRAAVVSPFQLTTVVASIAGRQAPLAFSPADGLWHGAVMLGGVPADTLTLAVSATDATGATATATQRVVHDRPPTITVDAPDDFGVARPTVAYSAKCTDDSPGACTIELAYHTQTGATQSGSIATGAGSISGAASLASVDGQVVQLDVTATDARGQRSTAHRVVYVESSTAIDSLGAAPSPVIDAGGGRALYARTTPTDTLLGVWTLGTHDDVVIPAPKDFVPAAGFVTPHGAMAAGLAGARAMLVDWRDGTLTTTATTNVPPLDVVGNYAAYCTDTAHRLEVVSETDAIIGRCYSFRTTISAAASGDVAYIQDGNTVGWLHGGALIFPPHDAPVTLLAALTDGTHVAFVEDLTLGFGGVLRIVVSDGTTKTQLGPDRGMNATTHLSATPHRDFELRNGWIAYTQPDQTGALQIMLTSPQGITRQVSIFSSSSVIDALGADGTLVFSAGGRRYFAAPGAAARDVGSALGSVVWRDGQFLLLLGRTVWRIPAAP